MILSRVMYGCSYKTSDHEQIITTFSGSGNKTSDYKQIIKFYAGLCMDVIIRLMIVKKNK